MEILRIVGMGSIAPIKRRIEQLAKVAGASQPLCRAVEKQDTRALRPSKVPPSTAPALAPAVPLDNSARLQKERNFQGPTQRPESKFGRTLVHVVPEGCGKRNQSHSLLIWNDVDLEKYFKRNHFDKLEVARFSFHQDHFDPLHLSLLWQISNDLGKGRYF
jgi:hypothetical protein